MSSIKLSSITNKAKTSGPTIDATTSSTSTGYARLASGTNEERVSIEEGSIRYNETAKLLEFYDGTQWNFIIPAEESANALGVFGGGMTGNEEWQQVRDISYITISTQGTEKTFGNLSDFRWNIGSCASSTRGIFGGGGYWSPSYTQLNIIEYVTISQKGNSIDFGDLSVARLATTSFSSSTRGVFGGGQWFPTVSGYTNVIDYITISTAGSANTFGSLRAELSAAAGCSNGTRGIFAGGSSSWTSPSSRPTNVMDYITISTLSTSISFGELSLPRNGIGGCSSSTRGVFYGGRYRTPTGGLFNQSLIDYVTIATTGNATYFGDLTQARRSADSCTSKTRAVIIGGNKKNDANVPTKIMDYITIATIGNAQLFAELTKERSLHGACSNNHGGLL
jgi:hypothetical protein